MRLKFLPALLEEAYGHFHAHLCASVLGCKLFVLPFQRDVILTPKTVLAMRASLNYCRQVGTHARTLFAAGMRLPVLRDASRSSAVLSNGNACCRRVACCWLRPSTGCR